MTEEEKKVASSGDLVILKSPTLGRIELEHKIEMEQEEQKNTWRSLCLVMNKNAVMYFTQVIIIFFVMCFAIYKLTTNESCEAQTTYMSLLTLCIGVIAPSPQLKKKIKKNSLI